MTRHQFYVRKERLTSGRIRQHRNFGALQREYARAAQRRRLTRLTTGLLLTLALLLGLYLLNAPPRRTGQTPHPEFSPRITDTVITPLPPPGGQRLMIQ